MDVCAVNAALKGYIVKLFPFWGFPCNILYFLGRRVEVKINTAYNDDGQLTSVWFDPPRFGYRRSEDEEDEELLTEKSRTSEIRWSRKCNLLSDIWNPDAAAEAEEVAALHEKGAKRQRKGSANSEF